MEKPTVSVVVPVYNIKTELPGCIKSLLAQTMASMEIVLVDDGSTDGSAGICDQYAQKDHRIRVIHKINGGLSDARNAGTAAAKGAWITYVDGDDYVTADFLEILLEGVKKNYADISICAAQKVDIPFETSYLALAKKSAEWEVLDAETALKAVLYQKKSDVSAWAKLFRTEQARKELFPIGKLYEDILTTTKLISAATTVAFTDVASYCYYQRVGSIAHSGTYRYRKDEADMTDEMLEYVQKEVGAAVGAAICKAYSNYCQILIELQGNSTDEKQLRIRAKKFLREHACQVRRDHNARIKNKAAAGVVSLWPRVLRYFPR